METSVVLSGENILVIKSRSFIYPNQRFVHFCLMMQTEKVSEILCFHNKNETTAKRRYVHLFKNTKNIYAWFLYCCVNSYICAERPSRSHTVLSQITASHTNMYEHVTSEFSHVLCWCYSIILIYFTFSLKMTTWPPLCITYFQNGSSYDFIATAVRTSNTTYILRIYEVIHTCKE